VTNLENLKRIVGGPIGERETGVHEESVSNSIGSDRGNTPRTARGGCPEPMSGKEEEGKDLARRKVNKEGNGYAHSQEREKRQEKSKPLAIGERDKVQGTRK